MEASLSVESQTPKDHTQGPERSTGRPNVDAFDADAEVVGALSGVKSWMPRHRRGRVEQFKRQNASRRNGIRRYRRGAPACPG